MRLSQSHSDLSTCLQISWHHAALQRQRQQQNQVQHHTVWVRGKKHSKLLRVRSSFQKASRSLWLYFNVWYFVLCFCLVLTVTCLIFRAGTYVCVCVWNMFLCSLFEHVPVFNMFLLKQFLFLIFFSVFMSAFCWFTLYLSFHYMILYHLFCFVISLFTVGLSLTDISSADEMIINGITGEKTNSSLGLKSG